MLKAFYIDESVSNPEKYMIRVRIEEIPFSTTIGSLNLLPARLLKLSYAQYLRFCRDILGAEIKGKNHLYPVAYFKRDELLNQFVKLLNARAQFVLWEDKHPDYQEHKKLLLEFDKKRNLKNSQN